VSSPPNGREPVDECAGRTLRPSSAIADYVRRRPKLGERPAFAAEAAGSADSAEEMKDTTGVNPWRLHFLSHFGRPIISLGMDRAPKKNSERVLRGAGVMFGFFIGPLIRKLATSREFFMPAIPFPRIGI